MSGREGGGKNNCRAFKTEEIRKIINDCWPVSSPCPLPLPNIFQLFQCYCVFYITLSAHELRPFLLESPFKSIFSISIRGLVTYVVYHSKPTIQTHYVVVWTVFRLDRTLNKAKFFNISLICSVLDNNELENASTTALHILVHQIYNRNSIPLNIYSKIL